MDSMSRNVGKGAPLPFKSLILLKTIENTIKTKLNMLVICKKRLQEVNVSTAYRSLNLVKVEMLEGMGPSREQPCICLYMK